MDIFESLEELNVSEECFDDIVSMVEAMLSEGNNLSQVVRRAGDELQRDIRNKGDLNRLTSNNKRRLEILGLGRNKQEDLETKAYMNPDNSIAYERNKVGGNNKIVGKSSTSDNLGARDESALKNSGGEQRQINKAKGRHYRSLKKKG